jgi:hypothetical protein
MTHTNHKKLNLILSCIAVIVTILIVIRFADRSDWPVLSTRKGIKYIPAVAFGAWTLGPPLWFLGEWSRYTEEKYGKFEYFKYSQELAKNVWIAVGVILAIILGFDFKSGG